MVSLLEASFDRAWKNEVRNVEVEMKTGMGGENPQRGSRDAARGGKTDGPGTTVCSVGSKDDSSPWRIVDRARVLARIPMRRPR